MEEQAGVFEELGRDEYARLQQQRQDDDFIVDDDGFGYKDKGGEIWEYEEAGAAGPSGAKNGKKRKLNVSGPAPPGCATDRLRA